MLQNLLVLFSFWWSLHLLPNEVWNSTKYWTSSMEDWSLYFYFVYAFLEFKLFYYIIRCICPLKYSRTPVLCIIFSIIDKFFVYAFSNTSSEVSKFALKKLDHSLQYLRIPLLYTAVFFHIKITASVTKH